MGAQKIISRLFSVMGIMLMSLGGQSALAELAAIGTYEVEEDDFVYAEVDGLQLHAHSYRPKKSGRLPAVVEAHGGAWNLYDRMAGELYNKALASSGLYVLAVDFRQGPDYKHPLGSRDVVGAVRYLRTHAERLNIDAESIGLIGSSSGGHLALLAGVKPHADLHRGTPIVAVNGEATTADGLDASVDYVIALWPVSDPFYRFGYAKEVGRDRLVQFHLGYFADEAAMQDASIARIVEAGEAIDPLPPVLVVQPGADNNIPRPMTNAMIAAYQQAGGKVDYAFYPGMPHAFAHRASESTDDCIRTMRDFIARQLAQ